MNSPPALLNERETAAFLSLSRPYLRRRRMLGQGPAYVKLGTRAIRHCLTDLEQWIAENRREPQGAAR